MNHRVYTQQTRQVHVGFTCDSELQSQIRRLYNNLNTVSEKKTDGNKQKNV